MPRVRNAILWISMLVPVNTLVAQHAETHLHIDPSHTRHTHAHGEKHATSDDRSRFHTSRSSEITLPLPNEDDAFFFVVYGDRTGGPDEGVSILKDAVRDTNLLEPDFVWTVGDLIQGYSTTEPWMEQMNEFKGIMGELLCPWFPVAGNHDVYWRGDNSPEGQHEANYEMHFGPLWYAFEHKNCLFITLYSDEGNPETGEKTFRDPENQKMSPEQFAWLKAMLKEGADAEHIFVSIHHPRWLKGGYGDDWDKVHAELVSAGNVSAVFAGHIHRMRYDPQDGIDYITLATVGGHQNGAVPEAGMLHHFNVITVRPGQVAHAAVPVGEMMDVREITGEMTRQAEQLSRSTPIFEKNIKVDADGSADATVAVAFNNPSAYSVDLTIVPSSMDSRWISWPDHDHATLEAGETQEFTFRLQRSPDRLDASFRPIEFEVSMDMLLPGYRYTIPTSRHEIPLDVHLESPPRPAFESVLHLDGEDDALEVSSESINLADGPMTLECWFNPSDFAGRTGLVAKTEGSEYGLFISDGKPQFSIHLDGKYRVAESTEELLDTDQWQHIAGVFDGSEVRLYLNGDLISAESASGRRTLNSLPLQIGADVRRNGQPMSHFKGEIDEVRVSSIARYAGLLFKPERRFTTDSDTQALFHMDGMVGSWVVNDARIGRKGVLRGGATVGVQGEN